MDTFTFNHGEPPINVRVEEKVEGGPFHIALDRGNRSAALLLRRKGTVLQHVEPRWLGDARDWFGDTLIGIESAIERELRARGGLQ